MYDDHHKQRLNSMQLKILKAEHDNLKSQQKSTEAMIELIRKIIFDEAKKIYGGTPNVD